LFSNPPEADYNRNDKSMDVLLSFPAIRAGKSKPPALRVVVDSLKVFLDVYT
jgi:hypothetical protein